MVVGNTKELASKVIESYQVQGVTMKVLVSPQEGWEGHVMRVFEVEPQGFTPKHSHPWPHINYIIKGHGELMIAGKVTTITPGSYAYVPVDTEHQFRNVGTETLEFICIVPEIGHK